MPEYLQATVDKFLFRVAKDRLYTSAGVWILSATEKPQHVRIGVTDFLQQHNGVESRSLVRSAEGFSRQPVEPAPAQTKRGGLVAAPDGCQCGRPASA